jgi:hypothetical protein
MPSKENVVIKDPEILGGTPVFRGTRVPVQTLFDYLEGGETLEEFLEGFPVFLAKWPLQRSDRLDSSYLLGPRCEFFPPASCSLGPRLRVYSHHAINKR